MDDTLIVGKLDSESQSVDNKLTVVARPQRRRRLELT